MSDLTLTERLRKHAASGIAPLYRRTAAEAAARIAELEAERDRLANNNLRMSTDFTDGLFKTLASVEAERDRLKAALAEAADWLGTEDINTDLPLMRAALSDPSGETKP